ncbi:MAG TPA: hypothetical protein VJ508_17070 [Saprospiraceae bacterium]|nr:hypothetical protein [Saprospiraceae bacterium]
MKAVAHFFSFVFHPLFVLTYMVLILLWTNPFSFGWRNVTEANVLLIIFIMASITMPAISVLMMKMLGWIKSFHLQTQQERIGPYLVAGVMYLTLYLQVTRTGTYPVSLRIAVLGSLISLWACFFINMATKISLHATGMGGLVALTVLTKLYFGYDYAEIGLPQGLNLMVPVNILLYGVIGIAGMVCTSRLILEAHVKKEVYLGFGVGFVSLMAAYLILT